MKREILSLCFLLLCAWGWSAYLKNIPLQLVQPDGTRLEVLATGDEYYNWVHDQENYTILQNETGWYVYALQQGENIIPGDLRVGIDSPRGLDRGVNLSEARVSQKRRDIKSQSDGMSNLTPSSGTLNNLVIFIKFAGETELEVPFSTINGMFNAFGTPDNSLKQYYQETSYNQLTIDTSFYPPPQGDQILSYTDPQPRGYYLPYSANNPLGYPDDQASVPREKTLLINAISSVLQDIPTSLNVDADEDGLVDNICFVVKGAPSAWATLLWPHMSSMYEPPVSINGALPCNYNLQLETFLVADYGGASVLAHEMFHSIGAPDLYRYTNTSITPIGPWDLMSDNSAPPQQTAAWLKFKYGHWITAPVPILQSGTYSLSPLAAPNGTVCYRINSWVQSEYYILEYRKPCGSVDTLIPGSGLLVYRMMLNQQGNAGGPPDELYIYRPHAGNNTTQGSLLSAALSAESGFTQISEATVPSGFSSYNTPGGLNLYEVGNAGDTISFKVKISDIQLVSPVGDDIWVSGSNKTIRWKSKTGQGNVSLEFSSDLGQNWITLVDTTPNDGSWLWENLPNLDSEECLIRISLLNSYHSDICTYPFSIVSYLAIPEPVYPQDQASSVATNPLLTWHAVPGATAYLLQVSDQPDFNTLVINAPAHPDSCYQASGLNPHTTFYWKVASSSDGATSGFSPVRSFTTGEVTELPGVPNLVSPANNSIHQSLTPLLAWDEVYFATDYHVQLARDAYYTNVVFDTLTGGQTYWHVPALSTHTAYYWRVAALNLVGSSVFSVSWKFTTGDGSPNEDQIAEPVPNSLAQNYPNPFNPVTRICFTVLNPERPVKLNIYNLKGQMVKELYNGIPGTNLLDLQWNACDDSGRPVASGVYLYRMEAESFIRTRKMLLLK